MQNACPRMILLALAFAVLPAYADTLTLRNGKEISGTLLSATPRQIEFLPNSGTPMQIPVDTVASLIFSHPSVAGEPSPAKAPAAKTAVRQPVVLPAGTAFRVRTIDSIDVDSTKAGARFVGAIDDPITSGGEVIVPRGAEVTLVAAKVEQGGRMKGSDLVALKVHSIKVRGRVYPVATNLAETKSAGEGKKTAGKILGGAGLGAIIGGIAGGGTGAGIGALVGGAGGTVVAASGQPHLQIPPETRVAFELAADWKIK